MAAPNSIETISAWLATKHVVGSMTSGEDARAVAAIAKLPDTTDAALIDRALARAFGDRPHLAWRVAPRLPAHVAARVDAVLARDGSPEARFVVAAGKQGDVAIALMAAAHAPELGCDQTVEKLRAVKGHDAAAIGNAIRAIVDEPAFVAAVGASDVLREGIVGLVAVALLHRTALTRLLASDGVAPHVANLARMAKRAGNAAAAKAVAARVAAGGIGADAAAWAKRLGIAVPADEPWSINIMIKPRGKLGTFYPHVDVALFGNEEGDWMVRVLVPEAGSSTKWRHPEPDGPGGDEDDLGLGAITAIGDVSKWARAAAAKHAIDWDFAKPRIELDGVAAKAKPAIVRWVATLAGD